MCQARIKIVGPWFGTDRNMLRGWVRAAALGQRNIAYARTLSDGPQTLSNLMYPGHNRRLLVVHRSFTSDRIPHFNT
mgnify:CR=1 FL=1